MGKKKGQGAKDDQPLMEKESWKSGFSSPGLLNAQPHPSVHTPFAIDLSRKDMVKMPGLDVIGDSLWEMKALCSSSRYVCLSAWPR